MRMSHEWLLPLRKSLRMLMLFPLTLLWLLLGQHGYCTLAVLLTLIGDTHVS